MSFRTTATSRRILVLAIQAVIFYALMPLWMALPTQVGIEMPICSTLGAKSVVVQFDTSGEHSPDEKLAASCPLCLASGYLALTPRAEVRLSLLPALQQVLNAPTRTRLAEAADWPDYLSRAPPNV